MAYSTEEKSSLVVVTVLLILSLFSAVVLFQFFESFAKVENKTVSLGGAAAGCVMIFILLRNTYFKLKEGRYQGMTVDQKIVQLEEEKKNLIRGKLDNFVIPEGYIDVVSDEFKFGFCYPEDWAFSKFPQMTLYGIVQKPDSDTNMNVAITDINSEEFDIDSFYEDGLQGTLMFIQDAEVVFKEKYLFHGLEAIRYRINWIDKDENALTVYQIIVADEDHKKVYTITFTTSQERYNSDETLFKNIESTFRI